jgi:predicted transcriptional regulator
MERIKDKRVRDVMTRGVITIPMDTPIKKIANILIDEDISGIAVVSPDGEIMGVISEMDIVKAFAKNWEKLTAEDIMSSCVKTVEPDHTIAEAAEIMRDLNIHRLLVLPRVSGRAHEVPVGILCASDILKAIIGAK